MAEGADDHRVREPAQGSNRAKAARIQLEGQQHDAGV